MTIQNEFAPSIWTKERLTVSASSVVNSTGINLDILKAAKYVIAVYNDTETKIKAFELFLVNKYGTLSDTIYSRLGDSLNVHVNAQVVSSEAVIEFDNKEAFDLVVDIAYVVLGS